MKKWLGKIFKTIRRSWSIGWLTANRKFEERSIKKINEIRESQVLIDSIRKYYSEPRLTTHAHIRPALLLLSREEVEQVAFASETPEVIAVNFQEVIKKAKLLESGQDPFMMDELMTGGKSYSFEGFRLEFGLYNNGLKLRLFYNGIPWNSLRDYYKTDNFS